MALRHPTDLKAPLEAQFDMLARTVSRSPTPR
jgi:hypothetical protein